MPIALLATKLHIPPLRAESVPRRRLLDRFEAGLRRKLTLVSAPAGFGKTTLISEWCASPQGQATDMAWVLLDEQDNDPVRFWSYVLAALDRVRPGTCESAKALLEALPSPGTGAVRNRSRMLQGVLTALVNDLVSAEAGDRPACLLVLDDYHTIHAPAIHDSLAFCLDYMPPAMHVVILTRADPPLPLARLRARDQLLEFRTADLRFTVAEVHLFLNQVMALDLSADVISALDTRTEGWAAGLQLAALSLQGLDPQQAQRFIAAFAGTDRLILNYLTEEVLQRQSLEVQTFLQQTSILPYLTAPLCDAVTSRSGSQVMLEQLVQDNLFTTPLDNEGRWYRYHPLFADTLRTRLEQSSPNLLTVLHNRASAWHEGQGALIDAVRHALAAGDPEHAARLVEAGYKRLAMRGELVTLHRWLDALPVKLVQARPRLGLAYALALAYAGRRELVERHLHEAEVALAAGGEPVGSDLVRGEIAALRAVLASVNWAGTCSLDLARQALQLLPVARSEEDLWLRILTLQALGNCHRFQGEVQQAEQSYTEARATAQALDSPFLMQAVTNRLGQNQLLQGRLRRAARTFETALRQAEDRGGELLWFSGELHAHLGRIYLEWHDLDQAFQSIQRGIDLSQRAENHLALLEGYLALAGVQAARGDEGAAYLALDQARQLAIESGVPYLEAEVAAQRAWLGLNLDSGGAIDAGIRPWAETWAARRVQETDDDLPLVLREFQDLILARFWLVEGRLGEAAGLLARLESAANEARRMDRVLRALVLRTRVLQQQRAVTKAMEILERALILAEPEGYMQTFLDAGPPLRALVADVRFSLAGSQEASKTLLAYVDRLLAAYPEAEMPRSDLQNRLTPRELEILTLMATGASNQEIASRLVVTVGTVKGHVNHILEKLEARNRTEAVARSRELGLLEH